MSLAYLKMKMQRFSVFLVGELSILALGPLTNLAFAFRLEPNVIPLIKNICLMGGNIEGYFVFNHYALCSNLSSFLAVADPTFNFKADPEAAYVVFSNVTTSAIVVPYEICKRENIKVFIEILLIVDILARLRSFRAFDRMKLRLLIVQRSAY